MKLYVKFLLATVFFLSIFGLSTVRHIKGAIGFNATKAEARVGRPLTPVSVAGVARRTTRRCAVGVYDCY